MAKKAYMINGWCHAIPWADITRMLKLAAEKDSKLYHTLWLAFAIMERDDSADSGVLDVSLACQRRRSGIDVDYARAFFPTFGLEWQNGMTREQGMQRIYYLQLEDITRMIFSYGQPRLKIRPAWAPSSMNGLEKVVTDPMLVQERGVRGELFIAKTSSIDSRLKCFGRTALTLNVICHNSLKSALLLLCGRTNKKEARLEILQMMLNAGAGPDGIENPMGWTPLHKAAEWSDEAIVSALIARGANLDAKMAESLLTPLIIANEKNKSAIVKLLLDAGADRNTASKGNL